MNIGTEAGATNNPIPLQENYFPQKRSREILSPISIQPFVMVWSITNMNRDSTLDRTEFTLHSTLHSHSKAIKIVRVSSRLSAGAERADLLSDD